MYLTLYIYAVRAYHNKNSSDSSPSGLFLLYLHKKVNGKLYTMKNCEEKHGYTWRSSAGGVILYFADENGKVFGIEREWLRKNAGRKG
jgi:hypothetical protein